MKYLLALLLIGLAALEFFHRLSEGHVADVPVCSETQAGQRCQPVTERPLQRPHGHH